MSALAVAQAMPVVAPAEPAILVPSMLGAGIVVSLALALLDLLSMLRGEAGRARRSRDRAVLLARSIPSPSGLGRLASRRLPPRWAAGLCGALSTTLGAYVLLGAFFNYWELPMGTRWSDQVAWLWALLTLGAAGALLLGMGALALALRGRDAPAWTSTLVLRTPLGRPEPSPGGRASRSGADG